MAANLPTMLTESDRHVLLQIARSAIEARVERRAAPPIPPGSPADRRGAFVTITLEGRLRGCIGLIEGDRPLAGVVSYVAGAAAADDPRFDPLSPADLARIDVEISVLGPLEEFREPSDIEVGRHGVVVEHKGRRGLLLPQVATEWNWDAATLISQTCLKAGLPASAWRSGARLLRFEAEVFGERHAR